MEIITLFILGASIGSFLNACIYRLPNNISLFESSRCPHCREKLRWFELVPVVSFIAVKGRCLQCNEKIPLVYPLLEILAGILTVVVFIERGISWETATIMVFIYGMITIAIIDWKHFTIPDEILVLLMLIGFGYLLLFDRNEIPPALYSGLISFAAFIGIKVIADRLFKKQTLGIGDIKLAGVLGCFLGWEIFLAVVWIASVVGSLIGIVQLYVLGKPRDTKLPFGTFLSVVSGGAMIFKHDIEQFLIEWITLS